MKKLIVSLFLLFGIYTQNFAQKNIVPTDSFTIKGNILKTLTVRLQNLSTYKIYNLGNVIIRNHAGVIKDTAVQVKGILLKDVLASIIFDALNPKVLSEYYFVCTASDGYKIVFSWNELFNSQAGDHIFIVTEKQNTSGQNMYDRIALICPQDINTGRRFLKALQEIEIKRVP